jgi:G:T-mismatch repair DNA endonuclease (very short patch repair protein)
LNEETIGQIPVQGYGGNVNQSTIALYWLRGVAEKLREQGLVFSSKLSADGERCILGRFVDGYCETTITIYQFHGCFFHGCKNSYDGESYNTVSNETFYTLRERTRRATQLFQQHGYTVVEMWECDFKYVSGLKSGLANALRARDFFANTI